MAVIAKRAGTAVVGGFPRRYGKYVVAPLLALLALGAMALGVDVAFSDRALPRLSVAGVDVGGASAAEVRDRLDREAARPWAGAHVAVASDGQTWTTTNAELAIAPDLDRAVADALAYGHTGTVAQRLFAWANTLGGQVAVPFAMKSGSGSLDAWLGTIAAALDRAPADGAIAVTYLGVEVTPAVIGQVMDRAALHAALLAPQTLGDRAVDAPIHLTYPAVDSSGIREAEKKARAVTTALDVRAGDRMVSEDAAGLATLLVIERTVATPGELDAIADGATAPATRYVYRVRVDQARVATWVSAVAKALDRPAQNATYSVQADGSLAVVPAVEGVKIDQPQFVAEALEQLVRSTRAPRTLEPAFVKDTPTFTTAQATLVKDRMTQVATFTTTYPPSASRHANITTGALQFNDLVLAPGETFSFWDRLGPVTVERGYAYAGAIINNRSDENVIGGGLCQVSTTLFNAVARSGYEILERHEHGYYIDRYPIGFDAAVFEPGVDFRWKNDTQYPVLIKAYPYATALRFDLISVPTGRRVVVGQPVQWNLTYPAPDQPADPAYLPGGVTPGRDVSRSWTVWEGDQLIHDQTFISHYVPVWGGPAAR